MANVENPIHLSLIENGLWLGNLSAAMDKKTLKQRNITHILTLDICPLPASIKDDPNYTTKHISVTDTPSENLLDYFCSCIEFIESALNDNKSILVHCYYGVSRSATIVIAYIMKKYGLTKKEAWARVKEKRSLAHPNAGFRQQLKLFYYMNFKMDKNNIKYRKFRLQLAAISFIKAKIIAQEYMDVIKLDPAIPQSMPVPSVYRCYKCRRILASKLNILDIHPPNDESSTETSFSSSKNNEEDDSDSEGYENYIAQITKKNHSRSTLKSFEENSYKCLQLILIEPLAWMQDITKELKGKIHCPKCSSNVGFFTWKNDCHCPCGFHIWPAFYLTPSKVDFSRTVQNVEATI